jgi:DNA-binding CsgD family transcriptional regulator
MDPGFYQSRNFNSGTDLYGSIIVSYPDHRLIMEDPLRLIFIIATLVAGAISIYFAFQLMRKYDVPFVGSYFYYLVFLYIFGAYSLIGSGVLEHLLIRMEVGPETLHSARLFMILLGIPLLALSKYMLLRCISELLQRKANVTLTVIYFILSIGALALYGTFVIRLTRFRVGEYQVLVTAQRWVFAGFMVVMYSAAFMMTMVHSRKMILQDRSFSRQFGIWYLLFMVLTCSFFLLSGLHEIISYIFIFIFLSWHLIPILFLSLYLEKYHGHKAAVQEGFEELLMCFSGKYEISNRECEVIRLISKGMSNQEISDALFISLQTVKDHIHHIFIKTGVKNRIQLTNLIRSG